jgi:hypothetical protein
MTTSDDLELGGVLNEDEFLAPFVPSDEILAIEGPEGFTEIPLLLNDNCQMSLSEFSDFRKGDREFCFGPQHKAELGDVF